MYILNDRLDREISIRERMIMEVAKSVEIAYSLCDLLDRYHVELEYTPTSILTRTSNPT